MAQLITGTVEKVAAYERKGKYGAFYEYQYTADGSVYKQLGKAATAPIHEGDEVQILFDTKHDEKYGVQNKVVDIKVLSEGNTVTTKPEAKSPFTSGLAQSTGDIRVPKTEKTSGGYLTPRDISIARMNAVTSAIALLNLTSDTLTIEDVTAKADEIIKYTLEPYNSK